MQRDAAAERVAQDERALDAEGVARGDDEIRQLREPRVLLAQRRRESEPRQVDRVRPVAQCLKEADLRRERERGRAHSREDHRVWPVRRTAGHDADPVAISLDDGLAHTWTLRRARVGAQARTG